MDNAITASIAAIVSIATLTLLVLGHRLLVRKHDLDVQKHHREIWPDIAPLRTATHSVILAAEFAIDIGAPQYIEDFNHQHKCWTAMKESKRGLLGPLGQERMQRISVLLLKTWIARCTPDDVPGEGAGYNAPLDELEEFRRQIHLRPNYFIE